MNARILITAFAAGIVLAGCAAKKDEAPATPAVDIAAEEQAIRARSAEWLAAAQAKDIATTMTVFAPDAITLFDGEIRRGSADIQAGMEQEQAETPDAQVTWSTDSVTIAASGDLAWETGQVASDPDGAGEKPARSGAFSTVWKKIDGQWKVVADAGTMSEPATEAAAPAN
jgi:uncharacterized protein (TIGR02246 family)